MFNASFKTTYKSNKRKILQWLTKETKDYTSGMNIKQNYNVDIPLHTNIYMHTHSHIQTCIYVYTHTQGSRQICKK